MANTPTSASDRASVSGTYNALIRARTTRAVYVALAITGAAAFAIGAAVVALGLHVPMTIVAVAAGWALVLLGARRLGKRIADAVSAPAQALHDDARHIGARAIAVPKGDLAALRADLDRLSADLHARVRETAHTIAELVRVKEHAQSANLAKSQFLADIGHDLRTPLNAIVGYATLLQEDAVAEGRLAHDADLARILDASRRLIEMISDVLDLSNSETGKLAFQPGIIDVAALVTGVTAQIGEQTRGNGLRVDVAPDIGIMVSDEAKIKRCLRNIVSNAFKYTDGGVHFIVAPTDIDGVEHLSFTVTDTGAGMTVEQIALAFDPFATASNGRVSGLGLAVTRRLVRVMGGDVTATSVPGEGTSVRIVLPRRLAKAPAPKTVPDYLETAPANARAFDKVALVVDDDQTAIALMRRRLAPHGYGVVGAPNGETGLALARSERPDLIVLDIHMPGMSGYEVLDAIRSDQTISATPVVVATVDDDRLRVLRSGASDYLAKPVAREQLADVLDLYRDRVDGDILIVDDDRDAGDLVERTAAEVGLGSRRAFDGRQAMAMMREAMPSAIVLDLTMPGISGFDLIELLRADDGLRGIPVVIVSGRDLTEHERGVVKASGCAHFTKGEFSPRQVAQILKTALNKKALAA